MFAKVDYSSGPRLMSEERIPLSKEEFEKLRPQLKAITVEYLQSLNEAFVGLAEGQRMVAEAERGMAEAQKGRAEAQKGMAEAQASINNKLTRQFFSIFNGKKELPEDQIDALFKSYLADGSLSLGKSIEGNSYAKIDSMKSVTKYLAENPNIQTCNFRSFKAGVNDIPTLAEYLKKSTVRAIAFNNDISDDAKRQLNEVVLARSGGLKVVYYP